jgi:hypothetical protein
MARHNRCSWRDWEIGKLPDRQPLKHEFKGTVQ